MSAHPFIEVAVPVPLRRTFDFTLPTHLSADSERLVGRRVVVPFGNKRLVGIVMASKASSAVSTQRLKPIEDVLDDAGLFSSDLWNTLEWMTRYYCAPPGDVFAMALPAWLRKPNANAVAPISSWSLAVNAPENALDQLRRAPVQHAIVNALLSHKSASREQLEPLGKSWASALKALVSKGWVKHQSITATLKPHSLLSPTPSVTLNAEQVNAATALAQRVDANAFSCTLLHGITGSGKTEVYFAAIAHALSLSKTAQVLVLVPEIGLTPQLLTRFKTRFAQPIAVMHSGLTDHQRYLAWWHTTQGSARIIIGTRSAVLASIPDLRLIVVDEEHDGSFKQQEGVRYHARDTAVYRAHQASCPIVLGSATPSLETFNNALSGRYHKLTLTHRATSAPPPRVQFIDLNQESAAGGLAPTLLAALKANQSENSQSLLYINRRGFAPALYCSECKTAAQCHRCDAFLTVHQSERRLRCHHCGYDSALSTKCRSCQKETLKPLGEGTQKIEAELAQRLPKAHLVRIDRDSARSQSQLEAHFDQVQSGDADIIIGTQLLTKGHDFAQLSLVGVLASDQALHSSDFRAPEYLFQQLTQVAGRAGRRDNQGEVYIQTHFVDHPLLHYVSQHNYDGFAQMELENRKLLGLPPFGYLVLLRAESTHKQHGLNFLRAVKHQLAPLTTQAPVTVMDAVPAPMARRAGRYRAQLLLQCAQRAPLHQLMDNLLLLIEQNTALRKQAANVRWSIDIDPIDLY